jgi:hypothetical protein
MRGRAWRRFKHEIVVKKRLSRHMHSNWWAFQNVNKSYCHESTMIDFLGTKEYFIAKTLTTEKHDTKNKVKFSPNKNYNYWRDHTNETREYQKKVFRIILKENGLI